MVVVDVRARRTKVFGSKMAWVTGRIVKGNIPDLLPPQGQDGSKEAKEEEMGHQESDTTDVDVLVRQGMTAGVPDVNEFRRELQRHANSYPGTTECKVRIILTLEVERREKERNRRGAVVLHAVSVLGVGVAASPKSMCFADSEDEMDEMELDLLGDSHNAKKARARSKAGKSKSSEAGTAAGGDSGDCVLSAKGERQRVFAAWMVDTFGKENLAQGGGVIDVAGGKGELALEVARLCGARCTVVDPRETSSPGDVRSSSSSSSSSSPPSSGVIQRVQSSFDASDFVIAQGDLLRSCSLLCGMHPDQATEAIVDVALRLQKPFAIVPCCVFPSLFPGKSSSSPSKNQKDFSLTGKGLHASFFFIERRLSTGQGVTVYSGFMRYLRQKHPKIEYARLGFEGHNRVLFIRPTAYEQSTN
jgi:hypothetical protein